MRCMHDGLVSVASSASIRHLFTMVSYARYFKQQLLSDSEIVIVARITEPEGQERQSQRKRRRTADAAQTLTTAAEEKLAAFPAHQIILFNSEYFEAQVQHWQASPACSSDQPPQAAACRPTFKLTIDSAYQLPAAEAVLAAMYGVEDAITSLEQLQQVHAAVIADMVHAQTAVTQAVQVLTAAAESQQGLTDAALDTLVNMPCWPACLQQLLQTVIKHASCCKDSLRGEEVTVIAAADTNGRILRMMLAVYGNLQAVWEDNHLQDSLLKLPLPAMQLLLSSSQLQVPSEDTVLYTAVEYHKNQPHASRATARAALAPLVRASQLSMFALSCIALPEHSSSTLMGSLGVELRQLLSLKRIYEGPDLSAHQGTLLKIGAPASWRSPQRQLYQADGAKAIWRLPVTAVAKACRDSKKDKRVCWLHGPKTAPLGGLAWQAFVKCCQKDGGSVVDLHAGPSKPPSGVFYRFTCTLGLQGQGTRMTSACLADGACMASQTRVFDVAPMTEGDGWDEAAWAAKGLPTTGCLVLELHMHNVS